MLLPLLSFIVLGLAGMKMQHKTAGLIGTCSLGVVTLLSYITAFQYFTADRVNDTWQTFVPYNFTWLPLGNLHFDMGILLDPISVMMLIVISTVSLMVHIYSFGYMHGEKGFQRYYAFLSLFSMSMLGLVLATPTVSGMASFTASDFSKSFSMAFKILVLFSFSMSLFVVVVIDERTIVGDNDFVAFTAMDWDFFCTFATPS